MQTGVGTLLAGRYRLGARIGRGGMADVFEAKDEVLHRPVAVKLFRFDAVTDEERARVDGEVHTLAALRHPGLVTVFDAGTVAECAGDAAPFLVMELISGPTLSQQLRSGPLPPHEAARLGADLAATLGYVHDNGVVHRDVKPANILLDTAATPHNGYAVRLTDFGIARIIDSAPLTVDGLTVGTANYLSPEQARGESTSPASDIYSLGLVLLECRTGKLAYPGHGVEAALARLQAPPVIPDHVEPEWKQLLTAMTADTPEDRPSTAQVTAALIELAEPSATTTMVLPGPVPPGSTAVLPAIPAPHSKRRSGLAALAAVAAVVLVLATLLLATRQSHWPPAPPRHLYPSVPGVLGTHLQQLERAIP